MTARCLIALLLTFSASQASAACDVDQMRARAVQDIEVLRRAYARATDAIGRGDEGDLESGRATYRRVFTADARIGADGIEGASKGPDAWLKVVADALGPMGPTQHLIGSQLVEIDALETDANCRVLSGAARLDSYLQAWHTQADGKIWLFLGNYADKVIYAPGAGWQISETQLQRITEEVR